MRDGNRLKEKVELRLDRRQITSLSVVALVLGASVFALGVMVGKNLTLPARSAPDELLDRLDAQVDAGASITPEPLTFEEELTRKLPRLPPPPLAPTRAAPKVTLPKEPAKETVEPAHPAPAPTATPDAGAAALAEAELPDGAETDSGVEVSVAPTLPPPMKPFFTVQVKATQSPAEADKFAQKLKQQGFQPLVAEAEVAGKGHWYRVRVGRFDSRPQADHYLIDFKRETHLEAFVTAAGH